MPVDSSLEALFSKLDEFRRFPKYALERRLDLFVSLFLEEYLSVRTESAVHLVAPEFPLKCKDSHQSTNVDYLLWREGARPAWLLLELKTSAESIRDEQLVRYRQAQQEGMRQWAQDIEAIQGRTRQRDAYGHLLDRIRRADALDAEVELAYLSPSCPAGFGSAIGERWYPLEDFARWTPTHHTKLWGFVRRLLLDA